MKPTEASSSRQSVSPRPESGDQRNSPPWQQEETKSPEREDRFTERMEYDRRSPEEGYGRNRTPSPDRSYQQRSPEQGYYRRKSSGEKNNSAERDYSRRRSPTPERYRRSAIGKYSQYGRRSSVGEEYSRQRSPSPERSERSPSPKYSEERQRNTEEENYRRTSPGRNPRSPSGKKDDYARRDSTGSYQTVKIKRSDLQEIRSKYSLRYKEKEPIQEAEEEDKSKIYKYSSNMRNEKPRSPEKVRSSSAGSSVHVRDSYGRSSTQSGGQARSRGRRSRREEWKAPESPKSSKLTAKERYSRRKSYDHSRSRSVSPLPDLSRVRSSGYGYSSSQQGSFRLMPAVDT